jgi:hypothetical protein
MVLMGGYWTRPERLTVSSRVAKSAISLRLKMLWRLYLCDALLERRAQGLQHVAPALQPCIQQVHAMVRPRHLARHRDLPAPEQPHIGGRMVWARNGRVVTTAVRAPVRPATMCISGPGTSRMLRPYQVILLRPPGRGSGRQRASSSSPPRAGLSREPSAPHPLGIGWPPRPTPLPHDCIGRDPTALGHQRFAVAVAEAEAAGEPHPMVHHLRRKPRALLRVGCGWWVHAASMPPQPGAGRWASSLDNAAAVDTPSTANIT